MKIFPCEGVSIQPIMLSRVDLPLPDGPAMARNTPSSILSVISFRAWTCCSPIMYSLNRFSTRTTLMDTPNTHSLQGKYTRPTDMINKLLNSLLFVIFLFCSGQFLLATHAAEDDQELARSILQKSDQIRFPNEGFQVD